MFFSLILSIFVNFLKKKLYAPFGNFRTNKIMVTAEFMNVQMEQHYVDLSSKKNKLFLIKK